MCIVLVRALFVTRHFEVDGTFGFTIEAIVREHWMTVEVFEIASVSLDDDKPYYERKGATMGGDFVETTGHATKYFEGFVKWDGCIEITVPETIHTCSKDQFLAMGKVMECVWDMGLELIPAATPEHYE